MVIAKASVAVVGVVGMATTSTIAMVSNEAVPDWRAASEDENALTDYQTNKFANKYKKYLAGVGETPSDKTDNEAWWDWAFSRIYRSYSKDIKTARFKKGKVKKGKDLERACGLAYKSESSNVKENVDSNTETEFLNVEVWAFCSPLGAKPSVVKADGGTTPATTTISGANNNSDKLVSVKGTKNDAFWRLRQTYFFEGDVPYDPTEKYFYALHSNEDKKGEDLSLKAACAAAYSMKTNTNSSDTTPTIDEVVKYCSLEGQ